MSSAASSHSDYPHGHRSSSSRWMTNRLHTRTSRKGPIFADDPCSLVDESPEFHDPYSELNLFLSQKIRGEMRKQGFIKKWSLKIQETLLEKIVPEFQKKFPHYRLGVSALRKSWEKIAYYTEQVEAQKGATDEKGNLKLSFLISENLRHYPQMSIGGFQPYHYAHQLGLKISECVAVVDGIRPSLDHTTRLIWSMQRHLLPWSILQETNSPYDEYDLLDRQIVKTILEIKTQEPYLTASQLETKVIESFTTISEIPSFSSQEALLSSVAALIAEKLYATSSLHTRLLCKEKNALLHFIETHIDLCNSFVPKISLGDLVRRILSLYLLATQLPKSISANDLEQTIEASYHHQEPMRPVDQALSAFLSAEILLRGAKKESLNELTAHLVTSYHEAISLPVFSPEDLEIVEIAIWRRVSEKAHLLSDLSYRIGLRIESEIAQQLIDDPKRTFSSLVHHTYQAFHKMRDALLTRNHGEIARKITLWSAQGDLVYRTISFDNEVPLLRLIVKLAKSNPPHNHHDFIARVCETYLREHPGLSYYSGQLHTRVSIFYKYAWYTLLSNKEESSLDRFVFWQAIAYDFSRNNPSFLSFMQMVCSEQFPFLPFDLKLCDKFARVS